MMIRKKKNDNDSDNSDKIKKQQLYGKYNAIPNLMQLTVN